MDGIASGVFACHQHDILSRQAMMYLLTKGWSLAHTSLAMTPKQSEMSEEYCCLKSARAGHSKSMCLSSPRAPVRHSLQIRLSRGSRTYLPTDKGSVSLAPPRELYRDTRATHGSSFCIYQSGLKEVSKACTIWTHVLSKASARQGRDPPIVKQLKILKGRQEVS